QVVVGGEGDDGAGAVDQDPLGAPGVEGSGRPPATAGPHGAQLVVEPRPPRRLAGRSARVDHQASPVVASAWRRSWRRARATPMPRMPRPASTIGTRTRLRSPPSPGKAVRAGASTPNRS